MKKFLIACAVVLLAISCGQKKQAPPANPNAGMQTLDDSDLKVIPVEPPPMITEQESLPKPKPLVPVPGAKPQPTVTEEAKMVELPFAPAIAMDPVDGDKVSIRSNTPMIEYKNKIYYFSGPDTKAEFSRNPDAYAKGAMARY